MRPSDKQTSGPDSLAFLAGGGEMGERTRAFDWSKTPVGPMAGWPQSLKVAVRIMLSSRYAMWLGWGPDFTFFYNDAYARMTLGPKHPWALGRSARAVWAEIWKDIGPRAESVVRNGQATWDEGLLLFLERRGFAEETYHTFSYSPVPDDQGGVGGMLCVVTEDTERALGERRLRTLRELSARMMEEAKSAEDACRAAARTLAGSSHDLPFLLIYLLAEDARVARLAEATGLPGGSPAAPLCVDLDEPDRSPASWPLRAVLESGRAEVVADLEKRFGLLRCGPWPEAIGQAVVVPMAKPGQVRPTGFVVAGVSPRLILNDGYKGFLDLLAGHVATAITSARAYEEERLRAEALAELDRAKTAFFSNVSHEFRTPLTLMLSPVEDILAKPAEEVLPDNRRLLEVVNRNGLRLLRLVNTLLDFSRIEAGRVQASYQPTDLGTLTAELASSFRSACERAGLRLVVSCPPLPEPVYVDREMWEKVVLNLLSNAFKYTFEGEIAVSLRPQGSSAELRVRDSGTGIPAAEMPRLFERFHRVENARGRTHEGSGIGLALVQELVKLHGGSIAAESEVGRGTTFIVTVPLGVAHLPADRIGAGRTLASTALGANPYVEEALRWLPGSEGWGEAGSPSELPADSEMLSVPPLPPSSEAGADRPRVLIADDNADMRQYIVRLLSTQYEVEAVPDGEAALAAARQRPPDLILTDVMMPRLDGFELLGELRADPSTRNLPVIMLSARAGEESRIEGMEAGADDYLVKPFSARDLLARVSAHLQMARLRREANESLRASEERFQLFMAHSPATAFIKDQDGRYVYVNRQIEKDFDRPLAEWVGKTDFDIFPAEQAAQLRRNDARVLASGRTAELLEPVTRADGLHYYHSFKFPLQDRDGRWLLGGMALDVTEQRRAAEELRQSEERLQGIFQQSLAGIVLSDLSGRITLANERYCEIVGRPADELYTLRMQDVTHPDDLPRNLPLFEKAVREGITFSIEKRYVRPDGSHVWVSNNVSTLRGDNGQASAVLCVSLDVTDRKRAEEATRKRSEQLRGLADVATRINAANGVSSVVGLLTEEARRLIQCHQAVTSFTTDQNWGQSINAVSLSDKYAAWRDYDAQLDGSGIYSLVCRTNRPKRLTQAELEAHPAYKAFGMEADNHPPLRGWLAAPLVGRDGRNIGLIQLSDKVDGGDFTADDEAVLVQLAQMASVAIENARLVESLRESDRRKDEFLATLAHELRNPLAPLRTGLQVMKLARNDAGTVEQSRTMMERQLEQMVRLIDDLLDLSRISRGKIALQKLRTPLAAVVRSAVETSRPLIEAAGHALAVDVPDEPIIVDADETRLSQVFANLLNNAAKYTDRGGSIRVTVERQGSDAVVTVQDTGVGIPAAMLPRVFDMFTQVDRSLEKSQGGLGIGLSIVKRLVEMHGGSIEAASGGHGMGSTFTVRLPVVLSLTSDRPGDETDGKALPTARRRILVVDDNRDAALSLAMMLNIMGNATQTAYDGLEAVAVAASFRPDVVLLDIGMPKLNGHDAARRIREQPWGKDMVLVALTGWGQEEDKRRSQEVGFNFHLVKPVSPAALEKLLAGLQAGTG